MVFCHNITSVLIKTVAEDGVLFVCLFLFFEGCYSPMSFQVLKMYVLVNC